MDIENLMEYFMNHAVVLCCELNCFIESIWNANYLFIQAVWKCVRFMWQIDEHTRALLLYIELKEL